MFQSSWWEIATHIISLASAYALALPVGWDRERDARSAGIRTFPLVAIASCGSSNRPSVKPRGPIVQA